MSSAASTAAAGSTAVYFDNSASPVNNPNPNHRISVGRLQSAFSQSRAIATAHANAHNEKKIAGVSGVVSVANPANSGLHSQMTASSTAPRSPAIVARHIRTSTNSAPNASSVLNNRTPSSLKPARKVPARIR